jgi:hypothetical protein
MSRNILASSRRHKQKRFFARALFIFLSILFALCGIITGLFCVDEFKIKNVTVSGVSVLSKEDIENKVKQIMSAKVLGIIPRDRIFYFPQKQIENILLEQFHRLSIADVQRDFPSSVLVGVEERKPVVLLCLLVGKECFFVDKTGFIFERAPFFSSGVFLKFFDERATKTGIGEFLIGEETFNKLMAFKSFLEDISSTEIEKIYLKDNGICEFYTAGGWYLILDKNDDWALIHNNFTTFFKEIINNDKRDIEYIDLRFGNKIFFK